MWDLLEKISWSESAWKAAFFVVTIIFLFALYHLIKFLGHRIIIAFNRLSDLSEKMDQRLTLQEQETKAQNERFLSEQKIVAKQFETHHARLMAQEKHTDFLMESLIKATRR